ncbi:uncharacterized protein LOC143202674 [Rhynchophorus ferrugineus]|uniref:Uncharacterized protein n=1 Tax=Rhynchophorus ferrugineus TaxID=354439 RepID=A0A834HW93_RHYFE|nr:hypothetical protein GWI33_018460 [Rhynchophorus ferrugineus]
MKILSLIWIMCLFIVQCYGDYYQGSNYFCTDLKMQQIVDISQLEGIWYVIEKIIHTEDRHYTMNLTNCPVIHITEDRAVSTTTNPLFKSYDTTYGSGYPYLKNPTDPRTKFSSDDEYRKIKEQYDRSTTYDYQRRKAISDGYVKYLYAMRYLRLFWDDVYTTEYHLKYNVSRPGFWISSGPDDAQTIPENTKHFAGVVQVVKAVGNHLVLTFCHRLNKGMELFTVILSRENTLNYQDIHYAHEILIQKGLNIKAVERTCSIANLSRIDIILILITTITYFVFK